MDLRAIDRLIAEKVMQIPQPPMEARITRCGANQVSVTGSVFRLRTGDEVPVPDGRLLQQPEGTTDWNDRYYHVVGMFLYSKYDWFKKEVEAYRDPAAPYSTSAAAAKQVREKLAEKGYWELAMERKGERFLVSCSLYVDGKAYPEHYSEAATEELATALCALKAFQVLLPEESQEKV